MGFLDELKNKLPFGQAGAYPEDDYGAEEGYDDAYYDDAPEGGYPDDSYGAGSYGSSGSYGYDDEPSNGVLGQTRRGEAESVAVYTRSGQLVGDADRHATTYNPPARSQDAVAYRPGAYDTPSSYAGGMHSAAPSAPAQTSSAAATAARVDAVINGTPQLPAYVLRPESYDDVVGVRTEVAKRVLDFSYGFACGLGASVREVGDRVFMVLPQGCEVKDSDLAKLRADGYLKS